MTTRNGSITVKQLCRKTGNSRQAYYQARDRAKQRRKAEETVLGWVYRQRARHPRMGGKKLYHRLKPNMQKADIKVGRDKLFDLLREHDLLVRSRKSQAPRTTHGAFTQWSNELAEATVDGPDQAWVADITYLRTLEGFCYLALISDKYSRKILGWDVADSLELDGALRAVDQAIDGLDSNARPIHHSDRGSQYRSKQYIKRLKSRNVTVSMTEDDHCAENAQAERLNGILKSEYLLDQTFLNTPQARKATRQAIALYNGDRPHLSLNYKTPEQVHQAA